MKRDQGFSQVELLISLAILSLIAVGIGSTLEFGRRVWDRQRDGVIAAQALARFDLRTLLEQADAASLHGDTTGFEARLDGVDGLAGTLSVVQTTGTVQFSADLGEGPVVRVIAEGLSELRISYRAADRPGQPYTWRDHWPENQWNVTLIKIEGMQPNGTPWPPFTVKPGKERYQRVISESSVVPPA